MDMLSPQRKKNIIDRYFAFLNSLKTSDGFIVRLLLIALFISVLWFVATTLANSRVEVPSVGGSLTEEIIGTPRFVNPVLAVTRADRDLVALIYDGLMKLGHDGSLVPNIAESITVSNDGLTYDVVLRKNITFHDGVQLTAKDVLFTVGRIQSQTLMSPLRASFVGVTVSQVSDYELNFVLPAPYAPFVENLTFGILPEHIWKDVSNEEFPFSQRNGDPIGSGPYKIGNITRGASGIPESYILHPNTQYFNGTPKIQTLTLNFFPTDDALTESFKNGAVKSVAEIDQSQLANLKVDTKRYTVFTTPLPRTFTLFFNENKNAALRDAVAREALNTSVDRATLVQLVLGGYGVPITSPIPAGFGVTPPLMDTSSSTLHQDILDTARDILHNGGWKVNPNTNVWEKNLGGKVTPLSFSISTANTPLFIATAEYLRDTWKKLGADVTIKQFEQSDLTQSIIRPRDYESLLFGTQIGRSLDFYPFWHSSQRNDPGLNMALYANITTDSILSQARTSTSTVDRTAALTKFATEVTNETPAIFLYTPDLIYVLPHDVVGPSFAGVSEPYERFALIQDWYINTESIWPFFHKK